MMIGRVCRGQIHFTGHEQVPDTRAVRSEGDLALTGQARGCCLVALSRSSVEAELSLPEQVVFSYEGRLKDADIRSRYNNCRSVRRIPRVTSVP